ncbi:MAG: hypothetical protein FWG33_00330 [Oscillospiraceae bacterium]|nr:hypothetical protein [Oscillospiraceae bacterium]
MERTDGSTFNQILKFFNNKRTKLGFSLVSAGYLWFLGWIAWLTFAYHFVYNNAAVVFLMYTFINVMFSIVMVYTRREIITRIVTLILPIFILVMLIYGFGNWFLILPPFLAAAVVFFASGVSESLKVVLGTIYMLLFVLAFLAYVTLQNLTIQIPFKMELNLRAHPEVEVQYKESELEGKPPPFRLVSYVNLEPVDLETKVTRTETFYIEKTDLDKSLWNLKCERVFGSVKAGALKHGSEYVLRWVAPDKLWFDGKFIEIDKDGQIITGDNEDDFNETEILVD